MQTFGKFLCGLFVALLLMGAATAPQSEWSQERLQRIDSLLQNAVETKLMIGGQGLVWQGDKVVYNQVFGKRDHRDNKPLATDAIYRIYSMSKPITSVGIMILAERGKLRLNDPLTLHLPEFANLTAFDPTAELKADQPLPTQALDRLPTIEDLLAHKAGFTYGIFGKTPVDLAYLKAGLMMNKKLSLAEFTQRLATVPLQYQPDTKWHYSVATDVLGRVIEVVSGQSLAEFFETEIFKPLGMGDTRFTIAEGTETRVATLYAPQGTPEQLDPDAFTKAMQGQGLVPAPEALNDPYQPDALFQSGGGGLLSTTNDYLKFARMLLNEGELDGVRLLAPSTVRLMRTDFLGEQAANAYVNGGTPREGRGFGLGFGMIKDQGLAATPQGVGTYYWGGAAGTAFWIDPENDLIGIFMTQSIPHKTQLGQDFMKATYQAFLR
jgi:CubicO group peptidase (beta-lactamase class C family)